jgi:hypothetical protein
MSDCEGRDVVVGRAWFLGIVEVGCVDEAILMCSVGVLDWLSILGGAARSRGCYARAEMLQGRAGGCSRWARPLVLLVGVCCCRGATCLRMVAGRRAASDGGWVSLVGDYVGRYACAPGTVHGRRWRRSPFHTRWGGVGRRGRSRLRCGSVWGVTDPRSGRVRRRGGWWGWSCGLGWARTVGRRRRTKPRAGRCVRGRRGGVGKANTRSERIRTSTWTGRSASRNVRRGSS